MEYQRSQIRHEVKKRIAKGLDKSDLVLIKVALDESTTRLRWEHENEFEYEDEMYDVVIRENKNDSLFLWCWHDHEETDLNRKLSRLATESCQSDKKVNQVQSKLLSYLQLPFEVGQDHLDFNDIKKVKLPIPDWEEHLTSRSKSPPVPPPRF